MYRIKSIEKALGFKDPGDLSKKKRSKMVKRFQDFLADSHGLNQRYVHVDPGELQRDVGFRQACELMFEKHGPLLWPNKNVDRSEWLVLAENTTHSGAYPRNLYYSNIGDREHLRQNFADLLLHKCLLFREEHMSSTQPRRPYEALSQTPQLASNSILDRPAGPGPPIAGNHINSGQHGGRESRAPSLTYVAPPAPMIPAPPISSPTQLQDIARRSLQFVPGATYGNTNYIYDQSTAMPIAPHSQECSLPPIAPMLPSATTSAPENYSTKVPSWRAINEPRGMDLPQKRRRVDSVRDIDDSVNYSPMNPPSTAMEPPGKRKNSHAVTDNRAGRVLEPPSRPSLPSSSTKALNRAGGEGKNESGRKDVSSQSNHIADAPTPSPVPLDLSRDSIQSKNVGTHRRQEYKSSVPRTEEPRRIPPIQTQPDSSDSRNAITPQADSSDAYLRHRWENHPACVVETSPVQHSPVEPTRRSPFVQPPQRGSSSMPIDITKSNSNSPTSEDTPSPKRSIPRQDEDFVQEFTQDVHVGAQQETPAAASHSNEAQQIEPDESPNVDSGVEGIDHAAVRRKTPKLDTARTDSTPRAPTVTREPEPRDTEQLIPNPTLSLSPMLTNDIRPEEREQSVGEREQSARPPDGFERAKLVVYWSNDDDCCPDVIFLCRYHDYEDLFDRLERSRPSGEHRAIKYVEIRINNAEAAGIPRNKSPNCRMLRGDDGIEAFTHLHEVLTEYFPVVRPELKVTIEFEQGHGGH